MVLIGHALSIFPLWQDPRAWLQQYGVVIFFLLSGFLISRTLHRRLSDPQSTFIDYAIDRLSRIYSGFLPALLAVVVIDYFATSGSSGVFPETVARYTAPLFFSNLFMLQAPDISLPFGSAAPFWTVAIEFWIYIFVGLIAFASRDGLSPAIAIGIALSGIIPVESLTDNNMVLVPWLLGAAAERLIALGHLDRIARYALALLAAGSLLYLAWRTRLHLPVYSTATYFSAATSFAAIVSISERTKSRWAPIGCAIAGWLASWSYSLYLLHHSILLLIAWGFGAYIGPYWGIVASIVTAISFATLTEVHHKRLAAYLKALVRRRSRQTASMFQETH